MEHRRIELRSWRLPMGLAANRNHVCPVVRCGGTAHIHVYSLSVCSEPSSCSPERAMAGPGLGPGASVYEADMLPLHYPAMIGWFAHWPSRGLFAFTDACPCEGVGLSPTAFMMHLPTICQKASTKLLMVHPSTSCATMQPV